jgi:hypothetical protein
MGAIVSLNSCGSSFYKQTNVGSLRSHPGCAGLGLNVICFLLFRP